ncbi:MAG: hypothetical protein ACKVOU_15430, partial [Cytophagales bacterium]
MKSIRNILFKVVAWCFFAVLALFSAAVLVIKLPSVQTYIIQKATTFVSSRTNTKVRIKEVAIVFPTSIRLLEVYAEDQNKDTLVFLGKLDVAVNLFSLFKKEINLSRTEIYDLNAKIYRPANDSIFNFQFIINAFAKSSAKPEEETPKDTISTNTPWTFYAGEFQLRNVKLAFADSLVGNLFYCKVSNLSLEIEELDLEMMRFKLNSLQIVNAQSSFEITKSSPASTVTGKAVPLNITLNKLAFENVNFRFTNKPENQNMSFQLGKSQIRNAFFDLPSLQAKVGRFDLSNSKIDISMQIDNSIITKTGDKVTFDLPKNNRFGIEVETINLQRNDLKLDLDNKKRKPKGVDFQHLAISNINLSAKKSHYRFQNMSAKIESFSAVEIGGLMIRNFATDFVMDSIHAEAKNLYLETQFSKISHYAAIGFDSWDGLSENIANLKIKADLHETVIDAKDIVQLQPDLINIDFINRNMSRAVKMDASIKGQLQDISIEKLRVEIGKNTMLVAKGNITGLPKISTTKFDILLTYLLTSKEDINTFLPSTLLSAIQLPDTMYANGSFLGTIYNFYAKVIAKTTDGYFNGKITIADLDKRPIYKANLEAKSLNIGKILRQKPLLGKATLAANVSGKGFSIEDMDVIVDAKIDSVFLHKYNYTKIEVKGNIKDKLFNGFAAINDPNLNLNFEGKVNMNQKINDYNFRLDILGADLQNLQLSNKDIRLSAQANANIKAPTFDKMNGKASIRNIVLYSNGKKYEVDSLLFVSFNDDKNSRMDVNSAIFKAKFNGNMPIFSLPTVLSNHFNYYFDTVKVKSRKPENFDFELDITNSPLIYEVIVPKLKDFVPGKVKGSFDSETHKLDFDASFISVDFAGNRLKNFNAGIHSNSQSLDYALGLDMFSNSQIFLEKTKLSGSVSKNIASIDVSIQGKDKKNKLNIASELAMLKGGIFSYSILPKGLMINDENWSIPEKNYIEFSNKGLYIVNMDLENGNQKMSINSTSKSAEADLNITFNQFQLINFSKMLEKTDPIARGKLDGTINFKNYNRQMAFVSDLLIEKTQYRHNDIGNISLKADNLVDKKYTISAIISGNENDIQLDGYLQSQAKSMDLNLDVRLKSLNLSAFQGFVDQQATKISGIATGNIKVGGNTALPEINGEISL